jgi:hypothetical protein
MDNLRIGSLITTDQHRDAIHMAVAPVFAAQRLAPGQHVGFIGDVTVGPSKEPIGIVDPFLPGPVFKDERFWIFLYPGSITSLRHEWEHKAFRGKDSQGGSPEEVWLRRFADTAGISYQKLLDGAKDHIENGSYLCEGGRWEGFLTPDEFWPNYEAVTKTTVDEKDRNSFFTCACN